MDAAFLLAGSICVAAAALSYICSGPTLPVRMHYRQDEINVT